jgi:hypothetical protein
VHHQQQQHQQLSRMQGLPPAPLSSIHPLQHQLPAAAAVPPAAAAATAARRVCCRSASSSCCSA